MARLNDTNIRAVFVSAQKFKLVPKEGKNIRMIGKKSENSVEMTNHIEHCNYLAFNV
jgi:hypothetical protein